jgi:hypothetical protein
LWTSKEVIVTTIMPVEGGFYRWSRAALGDYGKISLVLHREGNGWSIKQEMWNVSPVTDIAPARR